MKNLIRLNKTGILPSCSRISTTVWSHSLDSAKTPEGFCLKILYAVLNKSLYLTNIKLSNLANDPEKESKTLSEK